MTTRRKVALLMAALSASASLAFAQDFPAKSVTIVVPYAPGASTDTVARTFAKKASEFLGQTFVIDNRPGQAGNLGAEAAARATPDGYTVAVLSTIHAVNQSLYANLRYNFAKDFVPVVELGISPTVWVVRKDLAAKSIADLIELAKREPGKLTYGSGGTSAPLDLLKALTKVDIVSVSYKGVAPMMPDLISGRLDMTVASYVDLAQHIRAASLRAIALTPSERIPELPGVAAVGETIPGYEFTIWYGVFAPAATPAERIAVLRGAIEKARQSPDLKQSLDAIAIRTSSSTPRQFATRVNDDTARWAETVKKTGMRALD